MIATEKERLTAQTRNEFLMWHRPTLLEANSTTTVREKDKWPCPKRGSETCDFFCGMLRDARLAFVSKCGNCKQNIERGEECKYCNQHQAAFCRKCEKVDWENVQKGVWETLAETGPLHEIKQIVKNEWG